MALSDGVSCALVDANGARYRCVVTEADGRRLVRYFDAETDAMAEAERWKDGSLG